MMLSSGGFLVDHHPLRVAIQEVEGVGLIVFAL
jgi:hypothetical protein